MLDLLIAFAATGEIGALRLGMPAEEADRLLGGGTGLAMPGPDSGGSVGFKDGSLELWAGPGATIQLLGFDVLDTEGQFQASTRLGMAVRQGNETPTQQAMTVALDQLGCRWRRDDALTFDSQLAIRTEADVSAVFTRAESVTHGWVLSSLYKAEHDQ